ncbi:hypothetical protein Tco_0129173 [Tanacetum coccineum]
MITKQYYFINPSNKSQQFEVGDRVLLRVSPWKGVVRFGKKDANLHVPLDEIKVDKTLRFVEEPVEIMDREIKRLKRRKVALVKVRWNLKRGLEFPKGGDTVTYVISPDDEPLGDLDIMEDEAENMSPQSTPQVRPSFEEYTSPLTYPEEVEETLGTPIEVETLDETQLEYLGLNTCNHDIPLSSREVPSFDEPEPQPNPLPNCPSLDVIFDKKKLWSS